MPDPRIGDQVILRGRVLRIDDGVAVVAIRDAPGACAAVQCDALELDEQSDAHADAVQRAVDEAAANPGQTIYVEGDDR